MSVLEKLKALDAQRAQLLEGAKQEALDTGKGSDKGWIAPLAVKTKPHRTCVPRRAIPQHIQFCGLLPGRQLLAYLQQDKAFRHMSEVA
jgi:hypothetical protein